MSTPATRDDLLDPVEGFALLEVLVALTLLAVGIVAVLGATFSILDLQREGALRHRAGSILEGKLEEIAWEGFDDAEARGLATDRRFQWTVTARPWGSPASGLREVTVVVDWRTADGSHRVRATQLVRSRGGREARP